MLCLFDVTVVNAWVLYSVSPHDQDYLDDQFQFRINLAEQHVLYNSLLIAIPFGISQKLPRINT